MPTSSLDRLECARCATRHDADRPQGLCACGGPLLARYRIDEARRAIRSSGGMAPRGLWRHTAMLPVRDPARRLGLGEGGTPLLPSRRVGTRLGLSRLWFKDEGGNPTGSFKARGLAVAVARAAELGATTVALPTAGNAGAALACYAALHGLAARVYLPAEASAVFGDEAAAYGAEVVRVPGSIADAAARLARDREPGWTDISTLKEPYRLEGKKTMGYELLEDLGDRGELPGAIVYPTGGGTGLVGMVKAFEELEALGRFHGPRPRMISVQAEGCAPVVRAFAEGRDRCEPWSDPRTLAEGLRVPRPLADREILAAIRGSGGTALAVTEPEILAALRELAREEGILTSPEGGAAVAALGHLRDAGAIDPSEHVVVFLTGSALAYPGILPLLA